MLVRALIFSFLVFFLFLFCADRGGGAPATDDPNALPSDDAHGHQHPDHHHHLWDGGDSVTTSGGETVVAEEVEDAGVKVCTLRVRVSAWPYCIETNRSMPNTYTNTNNKQY